MSEDTNPKPQTTGSGISVDSNADYAVTGTVSLSRQSMGMSGGGKPPAPEKSAPPPQEEVAKMPYSVATEKDIACAKCGEKFEITPDFYNTVTECPSCNSVFVIRPPGTPPYKASSPPKPNPTAPPPSGGDAADSATASGIQVEKKSAKDYGITGTVLLSRQGMSMTQRKRGQRRTQQAPEAAAAPVPPPPPADAIAGMIYSIASENDIGCPKCQERFEISAEFYEQVAECPDCGSEFVIKPPGTPPYQAPAAAPAAPAPAAPAAPTPPAATPAPAAAPPAPSPEPAGSTSPTNADQKKVNPVYIGLGGAIIILMLILIVVLLVKM